MPEVLKQRTCLNEETEYKEEFKFSGIMESIV